MWVVLYLFTWAAGAELVNWSGVGAALLIGLFQGSTWMTELLSVQKYPQYAAYQATTSRLLPWVPGPSLDSPEGKLALRNAAAEARRVLLQRAAERLGAPVAALQVVNGTVAITADASRRVTYAELVANGFATGLDWNKQYGNGLTVTTVVMRQPVGNA